MTECIEFQGYRNALGYGRLTRDGRTTTAHRWAWQDAHGPIARGMVIMHTCDNPPCINIEHLRLGTQAENVADMDAKGRRRWRSSPRERNGRAKLQSDQVRTIQQRHAEGARQVDLAAEFGVSQQLISRITRKEAWRGMATL